MFVNVNKQRSLCAVVLSIAGESLAAGVKSQDRDETETFQKRIETAVSQFKTPTGEVCHLTT